MPGDVKNIAIIGANKEGLKLLPVLLGDSRTRVCVIADPNQDAMVLKLKELGSCVSPARGPRPGQEPRADHPPYLLPRDSRRGPPHHRQEGASVRNPEARH